MPENSNEWIMKNATSILCPVSLFVAIMVGCQRAEPITPVASETPRADSEQPDRTGKVGRQRQQEPVQRPGLTEPQERAIETIFAAGGAVDRPTGGYPTLIDLASERVFADDEVVRAVLEFPGLKKLRLAVSTVSPETLGGLRSLTELDELLLQDAPVADDDLAALLGSMPALNRLTLRRLNEVTDTAIDSVAGCAELEVLALIEMNQISGASLDRLRDIERLRSLDLRNCGQLAAGDYEKLTLLEGLTELKIGGPAVDDDVLGIVARLPLVSSLSIEDAEVSADGLRRLADEAGLASRLRSLSFARCFGVTDESLGILDRFPKLETLVLRDIMLTGSFWSVLGESDEQLPSLKTLVVTNAFLTDEAVALLPQLAPNLTRLDLRGNFAVTDALLGVLEQLPKLTEARLEETGVSETEGDAKDRN